jgi:endonuclease III-like uncharacterized protein
MCPELWFEKILLQTENLKRLAKNLQRIKCHELKDEEDKVCNAASQQLADMVEENYENIKVILPVLCSWGCR